MTEYVWRVKLDDGSEVHQYDSEGDEILYGSIDPARIREASWLPRGDGVPEYTVVVEEAQSLILLRRHQVQPGQGDRIAFYLLGWREGEREAVLFIAPGYGALLAHSSTAQVRVTEDGRLALTTPLL